MISVAHFSLVVSDIEKSIDFYTNWFDFKLGERSENDLLVLCNLHKDSITLELVFYKNGDESKAPGHFNHLAFICPDLEIWSSHLAESGLISDRPEFRSSPDGRRFFFIDGPDGERLEFLDQYPVMLNPLEKKLAEYLEIFYQAWHRLAEKQSPNRVHDLRVASRRLNIIMSYCSNICPPAGLKTAQKRLQGLFSLMGRLRDCQVELDYIHHTDESILDSHLLVNLLEKEQNSLVRKLQHKINAFDLASFDTQIRKYQRKLHTSIYKKKLAESLAGLSLRLLEEYRRDLASVRNRIAPDHPGSIHRFRIAAKNVRYSIEALHDYLDLDADNIERLRYLQDQAGMVQDLTTLAGKIEQANSIKAGTRQMMLGLVHARRDELSAQLLECLDREEYQGLWV